MQSSQQSSSRLLANEEESIYGLLVYNDQSMFWPLMRVKWATNNYKRLICLQKINYGNLHTGPKCYIDRPLYAAVSHLERI
jgi:hypothetical protein